MSGQAVQQQQSFLTKKLDKAAHDGRFIEPSVQLRQSLPRGPTGRLGSGILIADFVGGNANSTTGDYSVGIHGHWIERGRRVRLLAEMNLSGNALDTWMKLKELGNDPYINSSNWHPRLRFDALTFSRGLIGPPRRRVFGVRWGPLAGAKGRGRP
ncbi:MAG: hypothetical protein KAY24_01975 [Candidatus Eisenbacteria sp.]|nr:hypothetical protein [Candidatus Eisenbacteria bacterium]